MHVTAMGGGNICEGEHLEENWGEHLEENFLVHVLPSINSAASLV